ncbi:MAG: hypothetical protein ACKVT0_13680 [Planctomycetaceae bacterium]
MNMDVWRFRTRALTPITVLVVAVASVLPAEAATHRSRNFIVHASSAEIAQQVADAAEVYRRELSLEWLGREFKPWSQPCPITVRVGSMGAGGSTTFTFDRGEVFNWNMRIQGSLERILDSVLPHEISHTIFATHFRRPLPRWADEGAATLVEHESERRRQSLLAQQLLNDETRIPLQTLLGIKEYPQEMQKVLMLYAEGYTLSNFLVQRGGKRRFITFLADAHESSWDRALQRHYDYKTIASLENEWHSWILAGEPATEQAVVVRSQNPDETANEIATSKGKNARKPDVQLATSATPRDRTGLVHPVLTRAEVKPARTTARPRSQPTTSSSAKLSRDRLTTRFPESE